MPAWNGSAWQQIPFSSQPVLLSFTDSAAVTVNGSPTLTVGDANAYHVGQKVSGLRIAAGSTVTAVVTGTTVTLSLNATSSGTTTATVALPATTVYDVYFSFAAQNMRLIPWTSTTARATALALLNGCYVNAAAYRVTDYNGIAQFEGTYLGTFATTGTDGQTEDSALNRLVWNNFNRINRKFGVGDTTSSWALNTGTTWRSAHSSTANRVNLVVGLAEDPVEFTAFGLFSGSAQVDMEVGAAWDATNTSDCDLSALSQISAAAAAPGVGAFVHSAVAFGKKVPAPGLHYLQWTEQTTGPANVTVYGSSGTVRKPGLLGQIRA